MDGEQRPAGIWASASRLLHTLIGLIETRLELFALEWKEQRLKLVEILLLASASIILGGLSLIMVTITVIFAVWHDPRARLLALVIMTLLYLGATAAAAFRLRYVLQHAVMPFKETLGQLKKDQDALN